jgi:hypothetical protein
VDFSLDETQRAVTDLAASILRSAEPDSARVAQSLSSAAGYDEALWKALAQAGLLSLAVPERLGGDGFGPLEVAAVLSQIGRQTLPLPALATLSLGVLPLVALGDDRQQEILAEVGDGRVLTGTTRMIDARRDGGAIVLDGSVTGVPYAEQAYRVLVGTGLGVALLDPGTDGVILTRTPTSTGTPEYTLRCESVRVSGADVLRGEAATLGRFAVAGAAATADGVVAGALELTAEHLRSRHQFGKPLATFQAVAQQVADVYVTARTVELAAWSANWRLAEGLDADGDLDIAAYWLAAELPAALQSCHHLHGGLGVDMSYPLHRFYSHAKDLARFVGGSSARLDLIGARCSSN